MDVCIEVALIDKRPAGYDVSLASSLGLLYADNRQACPGYETHEVAVHGDSEDITNKVSKDIAKVVKLCVGAGVL